MRQTWEDVMSAPRKWQVTMTRWDVLLIRNVEAETEDAAREIALEWFADDYNVENLDGGVTSMDVEPEEV